VAHRTPYDGWDPIPSRQLIRFEATGSCVIVLQEMGEKDSCVHPVTLSAAAYVRCSVSYTKSCRENIGTTVSQLKSSDISVNQLIFLFESPFICKLYKYIQQMV
jgi:hypothetical protein